MNDLSIIKRKFYTFICNSVKENKLSHAYLIELGNYDFDYKCVLDFVKTILCGHNSFFNQDDSHNCCICKQVDDECYVDLKVIEPDGNFIKKQQLLDLKSEFQNKSLLGNKKIYIIKEAEKLNSSSANTILKFLEEPEDDIIAILLTDNRYKIIDTIVSRCQILSLKEDLFSFNHYDEVYALTSILVSPENLFINYNYILSDILVDKESARDILHELELLFIKYIEYKNLNISFELNEMEELLKKIEIEDILSYIMIIEEQIRKLEYNVNYKLWLDGLFSRFIGGSL